MTTTVDVLDQYSAQINGLPDDMFLGSILWFTVSGGTTTLADLQEWFAELGLDPKYLPPPINPTDAFRRATSEAKVEYVDSDGNPVTLIMKEVEHSADRVVRRIHKETLDRKKKDHTYDTHMGEAVFYKPGKAASAQGLGQHKVRFSTNPNLAPGELEHVNRLIAEANARYHHLCTYLTGQALRFVVRDYVVDLNAIPVRPSGGVYFVHKSRQETVDKLVELVSRMGGSSRLHTMPLIDTSSQRSMLIDQFEEAMVSEVEKLVEEMSAALEKATTKGQKIKGRTFTAFQNRLAELTSRAAETTEQLDLTQNRSASAFELAITALMGMTGYMEA